MRFNCGPTPTERRARTQKRMDEAEKFLSAWHDHFALVPRRVGSGDCRWLETIERKGARVARTWGRGKIVTVEWLWDYRAKQP